ncbi:MAG: CapA family protein [Clostridium sp.]|uniref:CapA family protein n=1 Tax=Clostridium sp. TaxID=1506 RepID=UPI003D6D684F
MKKSIKALVIICIFVATLISAITINIKGDNYKANKDPEVNKKEVEKKLPASEKLEYKVASVIAVGDILIHEDQLKAQFNKDTGEYNFENNFKYVKSHIKSADIALANFETTLAGKKEKYTGFPLFNSPSSIVDAMKDCGFDILSTINNHTIDKGSAGVLKTLEEIQKRKLIALGTRENLQKPSYLIQEVKGIKLGVISYSFETPRKGQDKTLNAIKIPSDIVDLLNTFSYEHIEEDLRKIKAQIDEMKTKGAEAIIFYIHWGNEYERAPNIHQKRIANALCDYGVDIILGSHPHVVQPIKFITSEKTGKRSLVVYSMGNFISNQQYERTNNRYTEDGIIVNIQIKKSNLSNNITISGVSYIPTWVHRYTENNKFVYEVLPLTDALASKEKYNLNESAEVWRAENSEKSTRMLMGESVEIIEGGAKEVMN